MSEMERVVEFIAQQDAQFSDTVKGASPEEIAELTDAVGRPLPDIYRQFLSHFGKDMGWLKPAQAKFDIGSITGFYQWTTPNVPDDFLLIGRASGEPYIDVYLRNGSGSRIWSFGPPPPNRFQEVFDHHSWPLAGNLPQFLALSAFRKRASEFVNKKRLSDNQKQSGLLGQIDPCFQSLDLTPEWFSDDWIRIYCGKAMVASAVQLPRRDFVLTLYGNDSELISTCASEIASRFGLTITL